MNINRNFLTCLDIKQYAMYKTKEEVLFDTKLLVEGMMKVLRSDLISVLRQELEKKSTYNQDAGEGSLIKSGEAAKRLGICSKTLSRWRDGGKIRHVRRNNSCYYFEREISAINQEGFQEEGIKAFQPEIPFLQPKAGRKPKFNLAS